jgi:hypothetical protein
VDDVGAEVDGPVGEPGLIREDPSDLRGPGERSDLRREPVHQVRVGLDERGQHRQVHLEVIGCRTGVVEDAGERAERRRGRLLAAADDAGHQPGQVHQHGRHRRPPAFDPESTSR